MDDSDMLLVAQGCSLAFERIVRRHEDRLVNWIRRVCNPNDAEDLAQEVFIRVFTRSTKYRPGNFTAWLFRIARNIVTDNARSSLRREEHTVASDECDDDFLTRHAVELSDPAMVAEHHDEIRAAQAALVDVLPDQADVMYCFMEGWSLPEISEMAGVCLATTKSRLRLCRDRINQAKARGAEAAFGRRLGMAIGVR